jgi:hypothetical protein
MFSQKHRDPTAAYSTPRVASRGGGGGNSGGNGGGNGGGGGSIALHEYIV